MPARPSSSVRALLIVVVSLLTVSAASCTPKPTLSELDHKLYAAPLSSFDRWWRDEQAAANRVSRATIDRWLAASPSRLDSAAARSRPWDVSTDLCSFAPDSGPSFDFRIPCIRHDFAWRNLKRLGRSTRARRLAASEQFLRDMQSTCAHRSLVSRTACRSMAATYFQAVSVVS
ncbi:MAG TPA: phospholipase A2 [Acidimicrobiales bacterium]|nr:phospholipase A2 [Acidimicrobiales bacterium]